MKRLGRIGYLMLIYLFLYFPMAILIIFSFNNSQYSLTWKGFTLNWYRTLLADGVLLRVAVNSLLVAVSSATLATAIGTMAAVSLYRYRFFGRQLLYALIYVIIMSPEIVMGISLLILFVAIRLPLGFWTLLLSHTTFCIPFVVVTVLSRLSGFDRAIVEAAKDLGASEFQTFRQIILPLLMPAVLAGWLLSFTLSMDDVIISFFVTGPGFEVLPLRIFSLVRLGVKPEINALCAILFGLTLVFISLSQILQKEKQ
ncbi:MAG TPA: spermidine/putrescine ABC transporter permease PotC [Syntrophobacteraceae bacterium]|nr:spermidine/putrescine ABC transporter permease PotC [Syntrophobacteraceae bacterium]HBD09780.1 spermidine/putrescine ABC transporter permease PotC [Syntrophobacteraceae bacterium]HBZ57157.1 spermidine/putrescine ABC transporter permease PotC [Syntrophobacteraceae bacterium]